jgi:hypothetical protein
LLALSFGQNEGSSFWLLELLELLVELLELLELLVELLELLELLVELLELEPAHGGLGYLPTAVLTSVYLSVFGSQKQ